MQARESPITLRYTTGIFAHNTIVANIGTPIGFGGKKTVNCDNVFSPLQASIIVPDPKKPYDSQFTGSCQLDGVIVHPSETYTSPGKIPAQPSFTMTEPIPYALRPDATNEQCCIDKVDPVLSSIDYFGVQRPRGPKADIGAHEVR
jgi:hypothetical protein